MEEIDTRESDLVVVDLESGDTTSSDEDEINEKLCVRHLPPSNEATDSISNDHDEVGRCQNESSSMSMGSGEGLKTISKNNSFVPGDQNLKVINVGHNLKVDHHHQASGQVCMEKKMLGDQKKKQRGGGFRKPPKPPCPPGGQSFNEADIKLVRQISEVSRLRRARHERNKALKKMRADKASSSSTNVVAMIITTLFFCVIIFQGILGSHV